MSERSTVSRFDDRVADYVLARPSYPREAFETMIAGLGEPSGLRAADVGAGTGISARGLADLGVRVIAIEPGESMRSGAEPHERVEWREGRAEATGLADASVDLVLCAQAYHWFQSEAACAEFGRILRPGGRLALLWNDGDESTPIARGYYDAIRAVSTDHTASHGSVNRGPRIWGPFSGLTLHKFRHEQRLGLDGLLARARSASYVPKSGAGWGELERRLTALHLENADASGKTGLWYDVWLWVATRNP